MRIQVNNFRKIESAELELNTITMIAGHNEAGKTSIMQAVTSALVCRPNVLGVTKKDAAKLIRDGSKIASVNIAYDDDNMVYVSWPNMETTARGKSPRSSEIAAGLVKFTSLKPEIAAKIISDVLKAHPTKEDFLEVSIPIIGKDKAEKYWQMITQQGWEPVHTMVLDNARDLKSEWKSHTKNVWGENVGATWRPLDLSPSLHSSSEEALEAAIKDAQTALEEAIAQNAVVNSKISEMKEKADKLPELITEKERLIKEIERATGAVKVAEEYLQTLAAPSPKGLVCPHCAGAVAYVPNNGNPSLQKAEDISDEERANNSAAYKQASDAVVAAKADLRTQEGAMADLIVKGKAAATAAKELKDLGDAANQEADPEAETKIQSFRTQVKVATDNLQLFKAWRSASDVHVRIMQALSFAKELAADGLRQRKAGEAVERFNKEHLQPLCVAFGISPITLDLNMNVFYRTHTYQFLSESAKFRVDCVLQAALSKLDGSDVMVIDGADIITGAEGRNGLIQMLTSVGIPTLFAMALAKADSAPDLSGNGGSVYWIENSVAKKIGA